MTAGELIPEHARELWAALACAIVAAGPVPCEQSPFPDAWHEPSGPMLDAARGCCSRCPVQAECLAYAVAADERFGLWGGRTADERAADVRATA